MSALQYGIISGLSIISTGKLGFYCMASRPLELSDNLTGWLIVLHTNTWFIMIDRCYEFSTPSSIIFGKCLRQTKLISSRRKI